ncbi:hypothetical protein Mapa_002814 [Marchantia paleacea]|nr:hypothetical protein Mapa_002814 [Marchantia paleacea]
MEGFVMRSVHDKTVEQFLMWRSHAQAKLLNLLTNFGQRPTVDQDWGQRGLHWVNRAPDIELKVLSETSALTVHCGEVQNMKVRETTPTGAEYRICSKTC